MIDLWPQKHMHGWRQAIYAPERHYVKDVAPATTFGDRPLWTATLDWGTNEPAVLEPVKAEILRVVNVESTWKLCKKGRHDKTVPGTTWRWHECVDAYSYANGTLTLCAGTSTLVEAGHLLQVGRYVLDVIHVDGLVVTVANFPKAIDKMTAEDRNALVVGWNRSDWARPLTIRATVRGNIETVNLEAISNNLARLHPITIIEVA